MSNQEITSSEENYKDILSYVKDYFKTRKFIFTCLIVAFILAVISILITPRTYSSKVTFIAQGSSSSKAGGGIGGLVSLLSGAGGGGGSSASADIPTFLYPKLVESYNFRKKLSETTIDVKELKEPISYEKYALEIEDPSFKATLLKYTIGLPKLLSSSSKSNAKVTDNKSDSLVYISSSEKKVFKSLASKVKFEIVEEDGTLEITTTIPNEPLAAAQLTNSAKEILQQEIIGYRIANAQEKYKFIDKQYEEKKKLYLESQAKLARYNDRNLFNTTSSSLIRKQQLQEESSLLYSVYSDLEQQRLAQSIKMQEDTPSFTIINPAIVPTSADSKNSIKTIVIFLFVGFLVSVLRYIFIVTKRYLSYLWRDI